MKFTSAETFTIGENTTPGVTILISGPAGTILITDEIVSISLIYK